MVDMGSSATHSRIPIPVALLVVVALIVVGLLLAQVVAGLVLGIVRLSLILGAFVAIGFVGLYLWRRGDISGPSC